MRKHSRFVWFVAGCLALAACGGAPNLVASNVADAKETPCDFSAAMTPEAPERYRAWVLFQMDGIDAARDVALSIGTPDEKGLSLLTKGDSEYVIVRADVVKSEDGYGLVVPVDAANEQAFQAAMEQLVRVVGSSPTSVLGVVEHFPAPPQRSSTYVTEKELSQCFLPEYKPFGRHPNSPGANPWG